ncbi:MAG: hypothetical protein LLG04_07060 [Parachlamydia sp.]|nr:hypothetical protein [Parachlamydia sp.]
MFKEWGVQSWDRTLGARQEAKVFYELNQSQFWFVNRIIGPIGPTAFQMIPEVSFVRSSKVPMDWERAAPTAVCVRGTKWESHLHKYTNILAFMIVEHAYKSKRRIILMREDSMTELQQYLRRLLAKENCGRLERNRDGTGLTEGRAFILRRICNDEGNVVKRVLGSAVQLYDGSQNIPFEEPPLIYI